MKSAEKVERYIIKWLKDYMEKSKMHGFVVGVSGGIDSAVTSTLCAKTGSKLLCLEMPIKQQSSQDSRASDHINWLKKKFKNVSSSRIPLDKVFSSFINIIPKTNMAKFGMLTIQLAGCKRAGERVLGRIKRASMWGYHSVAAPGGRHSFRS